MSILAAVIAAKDPMAALHQIQLALKYNVDAIELRLDCFTQIHMNEVKKIQLACPIPIIFVLRPKRYGGNYNDSEKLRLDLIAHLAGLSPEYFDLEYDIPDEFVAKMHRDYPEVQLICSYFNLKTTPDDLDLILCRIKKEGIQSYKVVIKANSALDTLRVMSFVFANNGRVSAVCLGEAGNAMQILAKVLGGNINYAVMNNTDSAEFDVLTLEVLVNIYNYFSTDEHTKVFSLVSGFIASSVGHIFHNKQFQKNNRNAVYIKIQLQQFELVDFFKLTQKLPFYGFSITMPFKERIIPLLSVTTEEAKRIGAVNTIFINDNKLYGFNTDGKGALDAIEAKICVAGKRVVIVGAGGAAKAIAFEAVKRKADVIIINIRKEDAESLAKQLGCVGSGLGYINELYKQGYDLLINATSVGLKDSSEPLPIPEENIDPWCAIMDVINKPQTPFINAAMRRNKNVICITGYEMYVNQALAQQEIWFGSTDNFIKE